VPVLAAAAAAVLLGEPVTARLVLSACAILMGIGLTLRGGAGRARLAGRRVPDDPSREPPGSATHS
ncbi:MAG TPA: EamA family transporter, partial [Anaeromyxobacteraceae bacterium]